LSIPGTRLIQSTDTTALKLGNIFLRISIKFMSLFNKFKIKFYGLNEISGLLIFSATPDSAFAAKSWKYVPVVFGLSVCPHVATGEPI
jgi:hypothetical protein